MGATYWLPPGQSSPDSRYDLTRQRPTSVPNFGAPQQSQMLQPQPYNPPAQQQQQQQTPTPQAPQGTWNATTQRWEGPQSSLPKMKGQGEWKGSGNSWYWDALDPDNMGDMGPAAPASQPWHDQYDEIAGPAMQPGTDINLGNFIGNIPKSVGRAVVGAGGSLLGSALGPVGAVAGGLGGQKLANAIIPENQPVFTPGAPTPVMTGSGGDYQSGYEAPQAAPMQFAGGYGSGGSAQVAGGNSGGGQYGSLGSGYSMAGYPLDQPWTQLTVLDPAEQANLDKQRSLTSGALSLGQRQLSNISDTVSQPLNFSSLGQMPSLNFGSLGAAPNAADYNGPNSATTDKLYSAYSSRLDPQWERERSALETRLANQGITVQSNPNAYADAFRTFNQGRNDAYNQALAQAISSGVSENSNAFGRALAGRQQGAAEIGQQYNAAMGGRQQGLQELLTQRNQPINELAALMGTSGGVNTPQFNPVPQVNIGAPDVMGAQGMAYNGAQNTYNQQMASRNAALGAAGTLAGVGLSTAYPSAKVAGQSNPWVNAGNGTLYRA